MKYPIGLLALLCTLGCLISLIAGAYMKDPWWAEDPHLGIGVLIVFAIGLCTGAVLVASEEIQDALSTIRSKMKS